MTEMRYPPKALLADYARGAIGLALTGVPLALVDMHPVAFWICLPGFALSAAFVARTALRQATQLRLDDDGVSVIGPVTRRIDWSTLRSFRLAYYSTRRDRQQGWMQLSLSSGRGSVRIESSIDGFDTIVAHAHRAARERRIDLSDATVGNLLALGLDAGTAPSLAEEWGLAQAEPRHGPGTGGSGR